MLLKRLLPFILIICMIFVMIFNVNFGILKANATVIGGTSDNSSANAAEITQSPENVQMYDAGGPNANNSIFKFTADLTGDCTLTLSSANTFSYALAYDGDFSTGPDLGGPATGTTASLNYTFSVTLGSVYYLQLYSVDGNDFVGSLSISAIIPPATTPVINSIAASNAGTNLGLGVGDTLTITFDQNTNKPAITAATIDAKLKLTNGHSWGSALQNADIAWNGAGNILTITFSSVSGSTIAVGDTITIDSTAGIQDEGLLAVASTDNDPINGTFTSAPVIASISASNAGSNAGLGVGDTVVLTFDQNTNKPAISAATINAKLKLNNGHSWGSTLQNADIVWNAGGNILTITFSNISASTIAVGDTITLDATANIKDSASTTPASTDSDPVTGTFTSTVAINSIVATNSGANTGLGIGDTVILTFDQNTNKPAITAGTIDGKLKLNNGHSWGISLQNADIAWNGAGNILTITFSNIAASTIAVGDTITLDTTANIMDSASTTAASTDNDPVTGTFTSAVAISGITASNAGSNTGLGIGDTIAITFNQNTNKPIITAATIDAKLKLNNGHSWGSALTDGNIAWNGAGNILTITFGDITNSTLAVGDIITLDTTANILDSASTTAASTDNDPIAGTFTSVVSINSIVASNAGSNVGLGVGDQLTITFDQNTNKPAIAAGTIDTRLKLNNGHSWGSALQNADIAWNGAGNILTITFSDVTNSTIAAGDTLTLDTTANIKDAASTTSASTDSDTIAGTFTTPAGPDLSINDISAAENAGFLTFTLTLSGTHGSNITVDYATANNTATAADGDFTGTSGTATITAGQLTQTVSVPINDDPYYEGNESFHLNLSDVNAGIITDAQGVGTITDNDGTPSVTLGVTGSPLAENGGIATVTATLSNRSFQNVTVNLGFTGTAVGAGTDYTVSSASILVLAGSLSGTATITGVNNAAYEANKTVIVDVTGVTNGSESGTQQVTATIADDETAPTVTLGLAGSPFAENGGVATVTATLNHLSYQNVTVNLGFTGSATGGGTDYSAPASITVFAGDLSGTASLTGVNDPLDEENETVTVDITSVTNGAESGSQQVTANITDDDAAPSISIDDQTVTESDSGTVNLVFAVTLSAASGKSATVDYATADNTATTGDTDYTGDTGTLTFTPGQTIKNITVVVNGDISKESTETLSVNLSNAANATISDNQGIGTITNDDTPLLSINDPAVTEGNAGTAALTFAITLSKAIAQTVTVEYAAADGTATTANTDYASNAGTLTFTPGQTSKTVAVTVNGDTVIESSETVLLNLTNPVNATISDAQGSGTITNDDAAPPTATPTPTPSPSSTPTPTPAPLSNVVILVNDVVQTSATAATSTAGGVTVTTVTINQERLKDNLDHGGAKSTVVIPVNQASDVVVGQLTGQSVKDMENVEAVLEIRTDRVTYTLPAGQINIDSVSTALGLDVELRNIVVKIEVASPPDDTMKIIQNTANRNSYSIVVTPVEFTISCTSDNKTVEVSRFNGYVERSISIPDGIDPLKITTGIVLNSDGTFSHVPTTIIRIGGKYYAKINSLTNSIYSVIGNTITFADMGTHWAKDLVNNAGSKLIVNGITSTRFAPDKNMTRAEFASILVKALGLMRSGTGTNQFSDVNKSDWYYTAVSIAADYKLITGTSKGTFHPNEAISRQEAMVMVARAIKVTQKMILSVGPIDAAEALSQFTDKSTIGTWAKQDVALCIENGIVEGSNRKIKPVSNITRAEATAIVMRMLKKAVLID